MTDEDLVRGLSPLALLDERVVALVIVFDSSESVAALVDVRPETLRAWTQTERKPHASSIKLLDDLRFAVASLLRSGLEPEQARAWFESRNLDLHGRRPAEVFREQPDDIVALAGELVAGKLIDETSLASYGRIASESQARDGALLAPRRQEESKLRPAAALAEPREPTSSGRGAPQRRRRRAGVRV